MFMDGRRQKVLQKIHQKEIACFAQFLTPALIAQAAARSATAIVARPLCLGTLVWLGVAAALHHLLPFASVLSATLKVLQDQQGFGKSELGRAKKAGRQKRRSKHDPRGGDPTQVSEEALTQARQRMPLEFWMELISLLGQQFQLAHRERLMFRGFRVLAIDGTTINLPDWPSLRKHFPGPKNAHGRHAPQARMVMIHFPFVRLPFRYELTPLKQGENTIAGRLIKSLEANDLLLMDAGYFSYGLFWAIQNRGAFFATRLPRRINVEDVKKLGKHDRLVRWTPKNSRGKWKDLPKSMELRLIQYQIPGYRPQQIVTNVLDPQKIPREDWVRLTTDCQVDGKFRPGLFHRRWEIETTFRELKVDQGMEGHLRCRSPKGIQWEVAGHVVLYLLIRWLIVEAAQKHGLDPLQISFLQASRELLAMRTSLLIAEGRWAHTLYKRLLERIAANRVRHRPGRHYLRGKEAKRARAKAYRTTGSKT
jgi:hypothetical protein